MFPGTPTTSSSLNPYTPSALGSYSHPSSSHTTPNKRSNPNDSAAPITRSRTLFYLSVRDSAGPPTWDRPISASGRSRRGKGLGRGVQGGDEQYGARNDVGDEEERLIGGSEGAAEGMGVAGGRKGKGKATLPPRW